MDTYTVEQFWYCISLLIKNYHAFNKQIFGCVIKNVYKIDEGIKKTYESRANTHEIAVQGCTEQLNVSNEKEMLETLQCSSYLSIEGFWINMNLLQKTEGQDLKVQGIVDFVENKYSCFFDSDLLDDFEVKFENGNISFNLLSEKIKSRKGEDWLNNVFKPKFMKWMDNYNNRSNEHKVESLAFVDNKLYNDLYKELKKKYSSKVLEFWKEAAESTDPLKFIYEDLAIAAYLITLWRYYDNGILAPKAFADLGCGNGLLVYILNEEGFTGYGYDIRARKIWSLYPKECQLHESPVIPESFQPPAEVDWLIGNHSDELSAWLPLLSAKLSYNCKYFVLPCCAFEFSGKKFQRRDCKQSVYQDFLGYVEKVSNICGFSTLKDRLKIPSTKRIALIGINRNYEIDRHILKLQQIEDFLKEEKISYPVDQFGLSTKIRDKEEPVRNCTKVEESVINNLVLKIFQLLLNSKETLRLENLEENWNPGGMLKMKTIVQALQKEELVKIKAECGGIKTLLKNKHEIFEFCGGDMIGIRKPIDLNSLQMNKKPRTVKKRICYFKINHPDGCPLKNEDCTFIH